MTTEAKDTPEAKAVQARMAAAGVASQSELHELYGKIVLIGDYTETLPGGVTNVHKGGPATIDYAVGDRFRATMKNGRQPWGLIADLVTAADGSLSYAFPDGA